MGQTEKRQGDEWVDWDQEGVELVAAVLAESWPLPDPDLPAWSKTDSRRQFVWHRSKLTCYSCWD